MVKRVMLLLLFSLALLSACGGETVSRKSALNGGGPTGAVVGVDSYEPKSPSAPVPTGETGKSAADALKEIKQTGTVEQETSGDDGTFYGNIETDKTGKDALKEKTRALMSKSAPVEGITDVVRDLGGAKYHDDDGSATNLPDEYSDSDDD